MDEPAASSRDGVLPFWLILLLTLTITINICLLIRLLPIFLVRRFPGSDAQGWAGTVVFAMGISGVAGPIMAGALADKFGFAVFPVVLIVMIACAAMTQFVVLKRLAIR